MRKFLTQTGLALLFIAASLPANAQLNINTNPFWEGEIKLLDGSVKSGFVQPPNIAAQRKISYKASAKGSTEHIERKEIASIRVTSENGNSYFYDNLPIGSIKKDKVSKKRYLLLAQARNNFVTFYVMSTYKVDNRNGTIDLVAKYIQGKDIPTFSYYMSKADKTDAKLYYMTSQLGGIKNNAELHFAEDPELVRKIKNKELKGRDILEIIQHFLTTTENM